MGANAGSIKGAVAGYVASRATKAVARATANAFKGNGSSTRAGTTGYKSGKKWNSLTDVNTPNAERQIGHINKQAFGGGQMRTDGEFVYRFDPAHKTGKIHMEVYKKIGSNRWQPYAECDPSTGNIIPGSIEQMSKRKPIRW